jgi:type II secretory pathway pseudopilin PulG
MSNVLIGIIGVILFIGLVLAGALFLGPRFQEATLNSKASAMVQATSQIANAIQMYNVQEGAILSARMSIDADLVGKGYLKVMPAISSGMVPYVVDQFGSPEGDASQVLYSLPDDPSSLALCKAVARQTAGPGGDEPFDARAVLPPAKTGCAWVGGNRYIVFTRV